MGIPCHAMSGYAALTRPRGSTMNHLLQAIDKALKAENHYAALAMSLALPDICGWVKDPSTTSKARYVAWFEKYLQKTYTRPASIYQPEHIFLKGSDCYALRCAYLHEGRDDIADQRAKKVLEAFQFVVPPKGWTVHCNQINQSLQLQVDIFCCEIVDGVKQFLSDICSDPEAMQRLGQMITIRDIDGRPL